MLVQHSVVVNVLQHGGGVSISANDYPHTALEQFAQSARGSGARLIVRDASRLPHHTLVHLAQQASNTLVLEL